MRRMRGGVDVLVLVSGVTWRRQRPPRSVQTERELLAVCPFERRSVLN